jgi:hypothetical protein
MKSPFQPLRDAAAARIQTTGYSVFDDFPGPDSAYPHITLGEMTGIDWSDKFTPGMEVRSTVHVWSRYHGSAEALQIMDAVLQALTNPPIVLTGGFHLVFDRLEQKRILIDIDGITRHGIIEMKYLIEEI